MFSIEYYTGTIWDSLSSANFESVSIVVSKDDNRIFYRKKIDGDIKFYGVNFSVLRSNINLQKLEARIKKDSTIIAEGYLNLLGKWDIDNSICELKFDVVDDYTPVFKLWDEPIKLPTLTSTISYSFDSVQITEELPKSSYPTFEDLPAPENNYTYLDDDDTNWIFAKELIPFPADGWDYDQGLPGVGYPFWTKYPGYWSKDELTTQTVTDEFTGFLKLVNVLYTICTNSGCDFDDDDYSTYIDDDEDLQNILIGYKGKIITPDEYIKAKNLSLSSILKVIKAMFNLDWYLDDGYLKFKHPSEISWALPSFVTYPAHDLTTFEGVNWGLQKQVYSYSGELPFKEIWNVEYSNQQDFNGLPIRYSAESDKIIEFDVSSFQANFIALLNAQNEDYTGDVSKDGFCIVACDSSYEVINETGIISGDTLINGKLALSQLHNDHFKSGRYFSTGEMNGSTTSFTNVKRTREVVEIKAPVTIDDFDYDYLVKTSIGNCEIVSVSEPCNGEYSTIKLLY